MSDDTSHNIRVHRGSRGTRSPLGALNLKKEFSLKKKEIQEQILKWAYEYAKSGNYENYSSIERKLHFDDGYPEARKILDDHYLRKELDELCY